MRARFERILSSDFSLTPAISRCHLGCAPHFARLLLLSLALRKASGVLYCRLLHHSRLLVWLTRRPGQADARRAAARNGVCSQLDACCCAARIRARRTACTADRRLDGSGTCHDRPSRLPIRRRPSTCANTSLSLSRHRLPNSTKALLQIFQRRFLTAYHAFDHGVNELVYLVVIEVHKWLVGVLIFSFFLTWSVLGCWLYNC
jgi:hypothetical protein